MIPVLVLQQNLAASYILQNKILQFCSLYKYYMPIQLPGRSKVSGFCLGFLRISFVFKLEIHKSHILKVLTYNFPTQFQK